MTRPARASATGRDTRGPHHSHGGRMSIRTKILGLTTAVALVAGASLAAAAPATAATPKVKGSTTITLDAAVAGLLASLGASLNATEGAKVKKGKLVFPVTGAGDGYISHKGQLQIITSNGTTGADNPMIEWPTDQPLETAILELEHPLLGPVALFTLSDIKAGKAKVKVNKKKKTRTSTQIIKATVTVDAGQAALLNGLLNTTLISDGQVFGKTMTKVVTVSKCQDKKCTK